jgi:plastocyanin
MPTLAKRVLGCLALAALLGAPLGAARADGEGSLRGRVTLELPGMTLEGLGPVVVYLEPIDAPAVPPPTRAARITQKNAAFSPAFLVVTVGQTVEMPNADTIYHNVFSYSRPNDFDLGMYAGGESRTVRLQHAGVVKVYCSIHESMNATIVVLPSRHYALAATSKGGTFSIDGIPPGRHRLRTWSEKIPDTVREITIAPGSIQKLDLSLTPGS